MESFNGKLLDEHLDRKILYTLLEAKVLIERWRQHYNRVRPHSSLGYRLRTPEAIAFPALAAETRRLMERGRDWLDAAQGALVAEEGKESPSQPRLEGLEMRVELSQQYVDALDDQDLESALESLNELA